MRTLLRRSLVPLLIACLASTSIAQGLSVARPEEVGLSSKRLGRIDELMKSHVERNQIAGAVTLVARRGKVAHLAVFGVMDTGKAMRTDTIFRIASMTKAITSVAVMMLFEEGRLLLTDPISKYIPEFKDAQVLAQSATSPDKLAPAKRPITIRHLLTHTSGITYRFFGRPHLAELYKKAGISDGLTQTEGTIGEMVKRLARLPLIHQPGEGWEYGLNTDVLGRLVEVASGMPLDRFFEERIFKPLGMKDTHFFLPEEKVPRLAAVYRPKGDGIEKVPPEQPVEIGPLVYSSSYSYRGPRTYFSGGAGLVSTASDYLRFLQMMLNGGELDGARVLGRKTVELMTTGQTGAFSLFSGMEGQAFGLGFAVHTDQSASGKITSVGEYNWGGFFYTRFWVDPREEMIGLMMTQIYPSNLDLADKFQVLAYQAIVD